MTIASRKYKASLSIILLSLVSLGLVSCICLQAQQVTPIDPFATSSTESLLVLSETSNSIPNSTSAAFAGSYSSSDASLPDVPQPQTQTAPADQTGTQTKRILGIIPNFRAVSADVHLPPQTVKQKFITASQDSFDYSSIVIPAALAVYNLERNTTPEFGHGGVGYGRYLWHSTVDQTVENYMVEFVVPAATHEDTRYYTLGHGGFFKRTGYALSRAVITRSDSGHNVFNTSEVVGAGAAAGISNLYYPTPERTLGNTGTQWGEDIGIDAATFVIKEFWPDVNHFLFHGSKPSPATNPGP